MVINLKNEQDFSKITKKGEVLLDFSATWCGPCQMMEPQFEKLSENYPKLTILKIDVDQFNQLAAKFLISSIPTVIYLKDGKIIKTNVGYLPYPNLERIIK